MEITVNKETLLGIVKENREKHGENYRLALEGYKIEARKELEDKLAALDAGEDIDRFLAKMPPEDHTDDYDDVIDMLTMGVGSEIVLSQGQFKQYAKDDWGWKANWQMSNTGYITSATAR